MLICKDCGKKIESSIEFDIDNFDVYCPDCGKRHTEIELDKIYPKRTEINFEDAVKLWQSAEAMIQNPIKKALNE